MKDAIRQLRGVTAATWFALGLTVLAGVANIFKLVLNTSYVYGYPDFDTMLVDPITGFAFGVIIIMLCAYLVRGLMRGNVWPAMLSTVMMPFLYLVMLHGVTGAITHENYFLEDPARNILYVGLAVVPSCAMVALFGVETLSNYRYKYRRLA